MTAEILSGVAAAFSTTFSGELTRIWNRSAQLLPMLRVSNGVGRGGGISVNWDVEPSTSGAAAATFTDGAAFTDYQQDPLTTATLAWGKYRAGFSLSDLEIAAAAANIGNADALGDIVGERMLGSIAAITDKLETDAFSGTAAPALVGLDTAIVASSSYGGISSGTHAEWAGNVAANGGTARALTMNVLSLAENQAFAASGMSPDFLACTAGVHAKYEGLFQSAFRVATDGQSPIQSFQGSSDRLFWRGKPVVRCRKATSGSLYMLNSDNVELVVLPQSSVPNSGIITVQRDALNSNGKDFGTIGIPFTVKPLASVGSEYNFMVSVYAQLKVRRPNAHVRVTDISES